MYSVTNLNSLWKVPKQFWHICHIWRRLNWLWEAKMEILTNFWTLKRCQFRVGTLYILFWQLTCHLEKSHILKAKFLNGSEKIFRVIVLPEDREDSEAVLTALSESLPELFSNGEAADTLVVSFVSPFCVEFASFEAVINGFSSTLSVFVISIRFFVNSKTKLWEIYFDLGLKGREFWLMWQFFRSFGNFWRESLSFKDESQQKSCESNFQVDLINNSKKSFCVQFSNDIFVKNLWFVLINVEIYYTKLIWIIKIVILFMFRWSWKQYVGWNLPQKCEIAKMQSRNSV